MKRFSTERTGKRDGYALLATLLILSLVVVVIVGLLSIQQQDRGRVALQRDVVEARANALYALQTALGELQAYAGPDQRTSASAEILSGPGSEIANPYWTGIWPTTEVAREKDSLGAFLVSGNEEFEITEETTSYPPGYQDPKAALDPEDPDVIALVDGFEEDRKRVLVTRQPLVETRSGDKKGHYAYWVGDEGVKGKVNLLDPYRNETEEEEKRLRFTLAQRNGTEAIFDSFDPDDDRMELVSSLGEFELLHDASELVKESFHDLTVSSKSLLTDTRNGGLRRDLSFAFEEDEIFEREFGAKRTGVLPQTSVRNNDLYTIDSTRLPDFYLDSEILNTARNYDSNHGRWGGGPNWGNLREYYLLYQRPDAKIPFLPHPRCGVKMRHYSFNPYKHGNRGGRLDYYHRNSPISPVLARAQMNVRLRTSKVSPPDVEPEQYAVDLEIQPVAGLWNPYNIKMTSRQYRFDWEVSVFLVLRVGGQERRYDLYRLWRSDKQPYFSLDTTPVELEPGEIRLFSVDSRKELRQAVTLEPGWNEDGSFWVRLPDDPKKPSGPALKVKKSETIEVVEVGLVAALQNQRWSQALQELQKHNTFMAIKYEEEVGSASKIPTSSAVRMNNLWKADDESGPVIVPEPGDAIPPFRPSSHTTEPKQLASWAYYARSSREDVLGHRNFVDSNVRAIVANSRWDGSVEDRGWRSMGWLNDGLNRALLPPGNEEPEADGLARYRGFGGNSISANGETHVILFDVPREPLVSLGQLQHANVGRYNNEPSYAVGNSYHNVRIPLDETVVRNFAVHDTNGLYSSEGLDVFDLSYRLNEKLWDSYFFSTLRSKDLPTQFENLQEGRTLPNSRYRIGSRLDEAFTLFEGARTEKESFDAIASALHIDGGFNVNSTSVSAWKAVLGALRDLEVPEYETGSGELKEWRKAGIVFSRLSRPYAGSFEGDDSSSHDAFWRGVRDLTEEQLESLAEEVVRQVKLRGPFRSLSEFVNRSLEDLDPGSGPAEDTRLSGTLQAALDRTPGINRGLDSEIGAPVAPIPDSADEFHDPPDDASQATGYPGYLLQGDVLQALGPILTARSDTFRIRAYGDKIITVRGQPDTEILRARAWCEAIVQRFPAPFESMDESVSELRNFVQDPADIESFYTSKDRKYFGRRFHIVSFRWLEKDEL